MLSCAITFAILSLLSGLLAFRKIGNPPEFVAVSAGTVSVVMFILSVVTAIGAAGGRIPLPPL